jgi:hypothetical protein
MEDEKNGTMRTHSGDEKCIVLSGNMEGRDPLENLSVNGKTPKRNKL